MNRILSVMLIAAAASSAQAAPLINGGFEDGTTNGWTTGGGYRGDVLNPLSPTDFLPGGSQYDGDTPRSSIISAGTVDPRVGNLLGNTVYSGNYSYRAEDTFTGGFASVISQKVLNYTDPNIFFAWKAVIQGAHDDDDSALMVVQLRDDTTGSVVINRVYNGADGGGGVDGRFQVFNGYFYTPQWQIEQLAIDASLLGHDFTISLLAADCQPTGHLGYAYIDGFGRANPSGEVPEPASAALLMLGAGTLVAARRRRKAATKAS
jgi:hypothetical protein